MPGKSPELQKMMEDGRVQVGHLILLPLEDQATGDKQRHTNRLDAPVSMALARVGNPSTDTELEKSLAQSEWNIAGLDTTVVPVVILSSTESSAYEPGKRYNLISQYSELILLESQNPPMASALDKHGLTIGKDAKGNPVLMKKPKAKTSPK